MILIKPPKQFSKDWIYLAEYLRDEKQLRKDLPQLDFSDAVDRYLNLMALIPVTYCINPIALNEMMTERFSDHRKFDAFRRTFIIDSRK